MRMFVKIIFIALVLMNLKTVSLWCMDYLLLDAAVLNSIKAKYTGGDPGIVKLVYSSRRPRTGR